MIIVLYNNILNIFSDWGWHVVPPVSKQLACNDIGYGALAAIDTIKAECDKHACNVSDIIRRKLKDDQYKSKPEIMKKIQANRYSISENSSSEIYKSNIIKISIFVSVSSFLLILYFQKRY